MENDHCDDHDAQTLATHSNLLDQDHTNINTHDRQHHGDDGCATPPRGTSLDSVGGTPLHFEDVASPDLKKPPKCAKHGTDKNMDTFCGLYCLPVLCSVDVFSTLCCRR